MANSLDNLTRIAQATFMQALAESPEQYAQCCQVLDYPGGSARLMTTNAGGLATEVTGATTSVSATDLTSGIRVVTQKAFALKHRMPRQQLPWHQPHSPKIPTYSAKESFHALKRTQGTARV